MPIIFRPLTYLGKQGVLSREKQKGKAFLIFHQGNNRLIRYFFLPLSPDRRTEPFERKPS